MFTSNSNILQNLCNRNKPLDCITFGRANVDLYPPVGQSLNVARTYDVFVGGSPANIAVGMAKRGLRCGIVTRLANDLHGHFVADYLKAFGIDVSHVQYDDSGAKTSLAFAERKLKSNTIMYRNNSADLYLNKDEFSKSYIQSSKVIFLSGTALVHKTSRDAILTAVNYAQNQDENNKTLVAIDIDYRAYGWKSKKETQSVLSHVLEHCEVIIGTREEFAVAGCPLSMSDKECATHYFSHTNKVASLIIIKHGEKGASAFFPNGTQIAQKAIKVKPIKPWGAGDAFASSCLSSLMLGKTIQEAMRDGAASASINISGYSCTEAMPTGEEITTFLKGQS